jgi:hypothetical protein
MPYTREADFPSGTIRAKEELLESKGKVEERRSPLAGGEIMQSREMNPHSQEKLCWNSKEI